LNTAKDFLARFPLPTQTQTEPISLSDDYPLIKRGIWLYFFLLIFEGALRKWFLPGLSSPLLVIRDPVAIWLFYSAWKNFLFPFTIYLYGIVMIGIVGAYLAVFVGHGNIIIALYGARMFIFNFPMIFIIGRVFTREDLEQMGRVTLRISIPMAILIAIQFRSPQSAWVNRGLAGDLAGAGFSGTADFFRPPGTFSFTLGVSYFFGWLAPFVFYFWLNTKKVDRLLLIGASAAMIASIPFSISRTLLFEVILTLLFTIVATLRKPEYIGRIFVSIFAGIIVLAALSQTKFFQTAIGAFVERFTTASTSEGGLEGTFINRFLGGLLVAVKESSTLPFFGAGMGMGSNVASQLLNGKRSFLLSEGEWGRQVEELGPVLGFSVILLRLGLAFKIAAASYRKMISGDLLPWLLLSFGFLFLAQGGWAQPTSLGFFVMTGGCLIASLQTEPTEDESE
jgi:hypothetical protein